MRLVQVAVPTGKRGVVRDVLEEEGVDYVMTQETSDRDATDVIYFPLPAEAVEPVLDRLHDAGIDERTHTVVLGAETVVSERFEELQQRYDEEVDQDRIARVELETTARDLAPPMGTYVLFTVVSAVIATAGLLLGSPAVIVGSMVIAPLIGPAMASAAGTVLDDTDLWVRGVKLQVLGAALAVGSAAVFALAMKSLVLIPPGMEVATIPEIRERLDPNFLSLAIAIGAGIAGATSLTTGISAALVGVMIAVALMPPAATVGIGIAWGLPHVALGSGVLALVNWLSINLAATAMLWYRGYRPSSWFHVDEARAATLKRVGTLAVAIAVLSVFLGGVTYTSAQNAAFEDRVRTAADEAVENQEGIELLSVDVEYTREMLFRDSSHVVVTVGREPGAGYPDLASAVRSRLDRDVTVEVQFVATISAGGTESAPVGAGQERVSPGAIAPTADRSAFARPGNARAVTPG